MFCHEKIFEHHINELQVMSNLVQRHSCPAFKLMHLKVNLLKINTLLNTAAIRQKLHDYLEIADDEKVKAIYTMVADEINTENNWDEDFVKELKRRSKRFSSGNSKTYSWEETKQAAIKRAKEKRK